MRACSQSPALATGEGPQWIADADVVASISLIDSIAAVVRTHKAAAAGEVVVMPATSAPWYGGELHAGGAVSTSSKMAVTATRVQVSAGTPLVVAWDCDSGQLLAVIEATALGRFRTSAATGAATSALAAPHCDTLGVIGTGREAECQVAAVVAVRNIQKIKVFSPTKEHRVEFAERVALRSGIACVALSSAEEATDHAGVVVTATRAGEPLVRASMLAERAHVNAVGAITPECAELEPTVIARARRVVSDDVAAARARARRELSATDAPHLVSLANLVAGKCGPASGGLSVFKPVGSAITDLALAELVIQRARAKGLGRPLTTSANAEPRIWSA